MIIGLVLVVLLVLALLCIAGRIKQGTWVTKAMLALDILISTLVWGDFDITISARCGLYLRKKSGPFFWLWLGRMLNSLSKGHCEAAITHDELRAQAALKVLS